MDFGAVSPSFDLGSRALGVDHIALAVIDLQASIAWYCQLMGAKLVEQRVTEGHRTGMVSAVLEVAHLTVVLVQGTEPSSQVSRFIDAYGPGVQHLAIAVTDLQGAVAELRAAGMEFVTTVIEGQGIRQIFTRRDPGSGMMYELIERYEPGGHFTDESVRELFLQLEASGSF